jgi:CBS domain-containing protein
MVARDQALALRAPAAARIIACGARAGWLPWALHVHIHTGRPAMKYIANILKSKADASVYAIAPTASMFDALKLMAEKNIGSLLVKDGEAIVGIVTERDYARKIVLLGRTSPQTPVSEVMSRSVMCVTPLHTTEQCMALMTQNRLRHLPVMDGGKLLGMVSIGDLVKDIISEQQFIIEQLEHYITGQRD